MFDIILKYFIKYYIKQNYINFDQSLANSMKKLILISLWFLPGLINAQQSGSIYGIIKDKITEEPLIGATVSTEDGKKATTTDIDGRFTLELPVGTYNLRATYIGYSEQIRYN